MTRPVQISPIQVQGLNHSFGKGSLRKQILFDVSTEIPRGEIVIVTGPSGSGKTTMLTLVGALRSAQEGSVKVLGEELRGAKPRTLEKVRSQIGFIFQQHNLLGALTALQNVELGLRMQAHLSSGDVRAKAKRMLRAVGLADRMHHKPDQLSGGQRQRVAIARALASEPAILLADEPTASLDKHSGREVVDRMKILAKEQGTTILLVTHDNRILDIADRIIHLEDGRLSTFTDAVIANHELMMGMLANNRSKRDIGEVVDRLDEQGFTQLLAELTEESQRFLQATALANDAAFQSLLEQGLFAFTRKLGQLLNADRSSLFIVEEQNQTLWLRITENLPDEEVRIPMGSGIAGSVASSGTAIRVDDAYQDPRFNPAVDKELGYRTRSILCLPVKNRAGSVFAVAQLLNRRDNKPFDEEDEGRYRSFLDSISLILETLQELLSSR
ncbi:MAG TPA: ATP-binding cassette domain-containing protein [Xanthomonadales bacterium]|nr:ATP-binding cassette domain-containing protein [Xanthomonadales bacterium]